MAKKKAKKERSRLHIAVLNGPNLNLLGTREPEIYGSETLDEVEARLREVGEELGVSLSFFQSNHEGALIDEIHRLRSEVIGFIVNAGGLTHTSVSLRDALAGVRRPFVEVHLSNVYAREPFRHRSLLADIAVGVICGFGTLSYELALGALIQRANEKP